MAAEFWYTLPLLILAFICFYLVGLYFALATPWIRDRDYHLVGLATAVAIVGTLLFSYMVM